MNIFNRLFGRHSEATPVPATGDEALVGAATISPTEAAIATPTQPETRTDLSLPEAGPIEPSTPVEGELGVAALELGAQVEATNTDIDTLVNPETLDILEPAVSSGDSPATPEEGVVDLTVLTPNTVVPPLTAEQASEAPKDILNLPPTEPARAERTNLNLP